MFSRFKKRRKSTRETVVYGFEGQPIDRLATLLSDILEVRLYPLQSPMIGPWYASTDPEPVARALREGNQDMLRALAAGAADHGSAATSAARRRRCERVMRSGDPG